MGDAEDRKPDMGLKVAFQSKELEELLDVIDGLRLQGIASHIDLPQLVVCGDQSSGKSSVLEALSGVQFPMKDNLCTRYPTEIILRRKATTSTTITIVPDISRSDSEKERLQKFKAGDEALDDFGAIVEAAGKYMGIDNCLQTFSTDVLRVELTGPTLPHLTLVDLPGLFHSGNKAQSDSDAQIVRDMVTGYMKKQRSIILAVVSAKNDYANQVVTKYAREVDPEGRRTLGIITKPDLLDEGSSSEQQYIEMAENKDVVLRLGWHVLKNRDYKSRDCSIEERNASEALFFGKGIWTRLSPAQLGIEALKSRLSRVLRDHIRTELPNLTKDIDSGIRESLARLDRLGQSRATPIEQRKYLHQASQDFTKLIQNAVSGYYNDEFFNESSSDSYPKRIRAVVANLLEEFSLDMKNHGKKYVVVDYESDSDSSDSYASHETFPIEITQADRLDRVAELIRETRGRELPGFTKFETVTTLFKEQCQPWEDLIKRSGEAIFEAAREAVMFMLDHTCDQSTKNAVLSVIVSPELDSLRVQLDRKILQNLQQHVRGHPITFNHYFTDNLQKLRNEHQIEFLLPKVKAYFHTNDEDVKDQDFNLRDLLSILMNSSEADMTKFTCSEALHFTDAYYKASQINHPQEIVALKFFVDDFSINTVEQVLLEKLVTIFDPSTVLGLSENDIEDIAGESEESKVERKALMSKAAALQTALKLLRQFDRGHPSK